MKWLKAYTWMVLVFLWSPLLFVVAKGCSIEAFTKLLYAHDLLLSFRNSLILATSSAFLTTVFGLITAFALPMFSQKTRAWIASSLLLPLVLPEIAFGLAYLVWFEFLHFGLGWMTLILAHFAFTFCYAVLVLRTSVDEIDPSLADAARDLGAPILSVFRHAVLPQITPGLLASGMMAFSLSLDDFLISFFVKGIDQVTFPIKVFSMMRLKIGPEIYALSVVLFGISFLSVVMTQVWQTKSRR